MKTHLTAFLLTAGILGGGFLIGLAIYTWRWVAFGILLVILFAVVYVFVYLAVDEIKDSKAIDKIKEAEWQRFCDRVSEETKNKTHDAAPSHSSYKSHPSYHPTTSPLIINASKYGTMRDYLRIEKHDPNTLYYITDKDLTYIGDKLLSEIFSSDTTPVPSVQSVP